MVSQPADFIVRGSADGVADGSASTPMPAAKGSAEKGFGEGSAAQSAPLKVVSQPADLIVEGSAESATSPPTPLKVVLRPAGLFLTLLLRLFLCRGDLTRVHVLVVGE